MRSRSALRRADGPITIIAGEQVARDDARVELEQLRAMLRARVATVPDAKDVAGTPGMGSSSALGVTGVMGHPGVATAVAGSALCLLVGTRMTRDVACRAGRRAGVGARGVDRIGVAISAECTHVHTDDLRGSLSLLTAALSRTRRPRGVRVPDAVPHTELRPPRVRRSGDPLPRCDDGAGRGATRRDGRRRRRGQHRRVGDSLPAGAARRHGSSSRSAWAGWGTASAPASAWRSGERALAPTATAGGERSSSPATAPSSCTAWRFTPRCSTGCPITFLLFDNHAHAMCVTREQLFYDDLYSYNRFRAKPFRRRAGRDVPRPAVGRRRRHRRLPAAVRAALDTDGPSVVSIECSADEIPPFANFLGNAATQTTVHHEGEPLQCRCPRLTTSPPIAAPPIRSTVSIRIETSPEGEGHADHHGDDAVGVSARRGVR